MSRSIGSLVGIYEAVKKPQLVLLSLCVKVIMQSRHEHVSDSITWLDIAFVTRSDFPGRRSRRRFATLSHSHTCSEAVVLIPVNGVRRFRHLSSLITLSFVSTRSRWRLDAGQHVQASTCRWGHDPCRFCGNTTPIPRQPVGFTIQSQWQFSLPSFLGYRDTVGNKK